MSQARTSKTKKTFVHPGTLASIVNQAKTSGLNNIAPHVRPNRKDPPIKKVPVTAIEEHRSVAPQPPVVVGPVRRQTTTESNTPLALAEEEHVQLDDTTPIEDEQIEEQGPSVQRKKRGKTHMKTVHGRQSRQLIVLNYLDQPVGPNEKVVSEFGSFLGTLARNAALCPLNVFDWRKLPTKRDIWNYVKTKYDIPESGKEFALETVQNSWRRHKYTLKRDHFDAYGTDEIRLANRPNDVPVDQFKALLEYWNSEKLQNMSKTNTENRKQWKNPHTTGKKNFALIRHEKEKETSDPLSERELFVETRKRKPNRSYKSSEEDTNAKIAEMEEIETQQTEGDDESVNAFASVMGPEHPGRLRLYGRGVTKTSLKRKVAPFEASINDATERRLEEKMNRMLEDKLVERDARVRKEAVADFIACLQRAGHEFPDTILGAFGSPGEASSSRGAAAQVHRPSTGSNNDKELVPGDQIGDDGGSGDDLA